MRRTVKTSTLLPYRAKEVVPNRIRMLYEAFKAHDFDEFARITMADSNQFHAICLDTCPPLRYMSDASWLVVRAVDNFNSQGQIRAAYTFDAGPNACVFTQHDDVAPFLQHLSDYLTLSPELLSGSEYVDCISHSQRKPASIFTVKNIIISKVGGSPRVLS
uniref:MDD_C domain-containing protein n=1 Tax=Angiostrongylus cantonensis TaxID=6313 RepID=A0A0K0CUW4_ANGCA